MGNYTACIDYKKIKQSSDTVSTAYSTLAQTDLTSYFNDAALDLNTLSQQHDNCFSGVEGLTNEMISTIQDAQKEFNTLNNALMTTISVYKKAEDYIDGKTSNIDYIIKKLGDAYGSSPLLGLINSGKKINFATSVDDFVNNMDDSVRDYMSESILKETSHPDDYKTVEDWKAALMKKYKDLGYSDEEAATQAEKDIVVWRMNQTGGTIAAVAISTYPDYEKLVDKYKEDYNLTEEQAKEVAQAEIDYKQAKKMADASNDNWAKSELAKTESKLNALKDKYGIKDSTGSGDTSSDNNSNNSDNSSNDNSSNNSDNSSSDNNSNNSDSTDNSSNDNNSNNSNNESNDSSNDNSSNDNNTNNESDDSDNSTTDDNSNNSTNDDTTNDSDSDTNDNSTSEEQPSTEPEPNQPAPESIEPEPQQPVVQPQQPITQPEQTYQPEQQAPTQPEVTQPETALPETSPETTVDTPTESTPNNSTSNEVIKIETPKPSTPEETHTSGGNSMLPLGLGIGAAAVAGGIAAKVIHDKKSEKVEELDGVEGFESDDYYEPHTDLTETEEKEISNQLQELPKEDTDKYVMQDDSLYDEYTPKKEESVEKYHAGTINKIALEGGYDINDDMEEEKSETEKEELDID